jgi:uncharacterized small protein (DUF1192 family)
LSKFLIFPPQTAQSTLESPPATADGLQGNEAMQVDSDAEENDRLARAEQEIVRLKAALAFKELRLLNNGIEQRKHTKLLQQNIR